MEMENEKENKPEGWFHLLLLQGSHHAPHPLPLCLDFWGFLPRMVPVLVGDRSPPLDPMSRGREMVSPGTASKKAWVYKFVSRAVPMQHPAKFI